MARNNQRGGRNNNPSGRNQYSSDWMGTVRDRPMTTAAAAAAAVGAGVFLWSRRNEISDQISRLSDQISDWAGDKRSEDSGSDMAMAGGPDQSSAIGSSSTTRGNRSSRSTSSKGRGSSSRSASPAMSSGSSGTDTMTH